MRFTKMHGLGNDYLYVYAETLPDDAPELSVRLRPLPGSSPGDVLHAS